jgi:hypothetical protein
VEYYLNHSRKIWNRITLRREGVKRSVDLQTVEALTLRAPGISNVNKEFTVDAMHTGFLFPKLVGPLRDLPADIF